MKNLPTSLRAFTLIELLVVISIIAILAGLALPSITGALARGQMTQSVSNAREIYKAAFQMSLDGQATGDTNLAWPGDIGSNNTTWSVWANALVGGKYMSTNDFNKMLSAPGLVRPASTAPSSATPSAFTVYAVSETNAASVIFITTANFTAPNTPLVSGAKPYGDKGFVVLRRGGDGNVYLGNQATNTNVISTTDFVNKLQ